MPKYQVTVVKQGTIIVEAESPEHADQIARDKDVDGCFWMDYIVEVEEQPCRSNDSH